MRQAILPLPAFGSSSLLVATAAYIVNQRWQFPWCNPASHLCCRLRNEHVLWWLTLQCLQACFHAFMYITDTHVVFLFRWFCCMIPRHIFVTCWNIVALLCCFWCCLGTKVRSKLIALWDKGPFKNDDAIGEKGQISGPSFGPKTEPYIHMHT